MFSFQNIWSYYPFFYNHNKYNMKSKIVNHYSDNFSKILLTPIIDLNAFLPNFSQFDPDKLFNKDNNIVNILRCCNLENNFEYLYHFMNISEKKEESIDYEISQQKQNIFKLINKIFYEKIHNNLLDKEKKNENDETIIIDYIFNNYINTIKYNINLNKIKNHQYSSCLIKIGYHVR